MGKIKGRGHEDTPHLLEYRKYFFIWWTAYVLVNCWATQLFSALFFIGHYIAQLTCFKKKKKLNKLRDHSHLLAPYDH